MGLAPDWRATGTATSVGNRGSSFGQPGQHASTPQTSATWSARLRDSHPPERDTHPVLHERSSTSGDSGNGDGATDSDGVVINFAAFADDPDTNERDAVGTTSTASTQAIEPLTWDAPATSRAVSRPIACGLQMLQSRGEDFESTRTAPSQIQDASESSSQRGGESGITQ